MLDRRLPSRKALAAVILAALGASALFACSSAATSTPKDKGETFEEDPTDPVLGPPRQPDYQNDDSGAFPVGERQANHDGGDSDAGRHDLGDAGTLLCATPLGPGDFRVVELMISSAAGSGDHGEWVEVQNVRDCALNVKGLTIASPRGATSTDSATVSTDLIIPAFGMLVAAGSSDPALNHSLPVPVISWNATDVLKNDGDTVNVTLNGTTIDTITYPHFSTLTPGRSISFPADCAWSDRADWNRWSYSFASYAGSPDAGTVFEGTPNDDNWDVACY